MKNKKVGLMVRRFLLIFFATACFAGVIVVLIIAMRETDDVTRDMKTVEDIIQQVIIEPTDETQIFESADDEIDNDYFDNTYYGYQTNSLKINYDWYLQRRIDFDSLCAINSDATRWITIPNTNIDYYIMQEQTVGESFYLWRDIYKSQSSWGSLLTPKEPDTNIINSAHLLIFGHHMTNTGVAFSSLPTYYTSSYSSDDYSYVYMYYPDHSERWRVWTACDGTADDMVYTIPYELGSDDYDKLLNNIMINGRYQRIGRPDKDTKILVLSTCNGQQNGKDGRFYVVCVPDVKYDYNTHKISNL